ncbi:rhodanese-like domain-containing protein [Celeribacter neptunius]|uniref:Rhodanese-related sulfurtransferase n=1 Tax=Celeribacter neptunius TaxID=588602 RepID=A0A1I3W3P2_9RHOB|nr:rhodanese-like domain-containing protein [Celeribacter neptunius]SFK02254.1 Rhodanese-related sulfurtransferase [Celeribacter neptunius]
MRRFLIVGMMAAGLTSGLSVVPACADEATVEAMQDYLMFQDYESGIILPQQITEEVWDAVYFIDTRDAGQFEAGTIPGAVNIEWREVLDRMDEIPTDKKVVLFCNTGSLSAQAAFALRVAGRENVVVLQTGRDGWLETAGYKPE